MRKVAWLIAATFTAILAVSKIFGVLSLSLIAVFAPIIVVASFWVIDYALFGLIVGWYVKLIPKENATKLRNDIMTTICKKLSV